MLASDDDALKQHSTLNVLNHKQPEMDEYNSGMDHGVRLYFQKIMKSFGVGLFWLLIVMTMGLFFRLGHVQNGVHWYNLAFYVFALLTFLAVLRFFFLVWRKKAVDDNRESAIQEKS